MTRSKAEIFQDSMMASRLSNDDADFQELAGADPKTSIKIQALKDLVTLNLLDKDDPLVEIMLVLLNGRRKALFATSPQVNEISKMGMMLPQGVEAYRGRRTKDD